MADAVATLDAELAITRTFRAPREAVFQAFTAPEKLSLWFAPTDAHEVPFVEVDLRIGGRHRIDLRGPPGRLYRVVGEYLEIDPPTPPGSKWGWELRRDPCE